MPRHLAGFGKFSTSDLAAKRVFSGQPGNRRHSQFGPSDCSRQYRSVGEPGRRSSEGQGEHLYNMLNSAWQRARVRAKLPGFRVHDLRLTFGHRLRAAGVGFEDRQDLLGHKSERITTHYSAPDNARLIEAAEKVCERRANTVLRVAAHTILTRSGTQNGSSRVDHKQVIEV